jgi:hypothetical protein
MQSRITRRGFLRGALGVGALAALGPGLLPSESGAAAEAKRKLIIVLFGGGTRYSESMGDPKHEYIPHLWNEMVPKGTLFTDMRVEHRVVHPNSAGSIVTGHWEWDDLDWSRPVAHPTLFEVYRKAASAPDTKIWEFVYASILAQTGLSRAPGYGAKFAANVVEPPTIPRSTADEMDKLMQNAADGSTVDGLKAASKCAELARTTSKINLAGLRSDAARKWAEAEYAAWKSGSGSTSHDLFLTNSAINCMREFSPDVMAVMYGEIDCAHYGSWSRYVEAIQRTDDLTWRLWKATEDMADYCGKTLFLILPDHGRELEKPGGMGFIHHSDFYTNKGADEGCRRVWMLAMGPGVAPGRKIGNATPITSIAATGLDYLGLRLPKGGQGSLLSATRRA